MLHLGSRDVGFAGADWVAELVGRARRAARYRARPGGRGRRRDARAHARAASRAAPFVVASEYERLTRAWLERRGYRATFVHSYGATEVFPPEDADCIVDNMATGETLKANGLIIVDELMRSSTRLYAHPRRSSSPRSACASTRWCCCCARCSMRASA